MDWSMPARDLIDFQGFVGILYKENLIDDVVKVFFMFGGLFEFL